MVLVEKTPIGRLIFSVMSAFAKLNPDFREGRPKKYNKKQIDHELTLLTIHSYKQVAEMTGISESTLLWAKRARDKCNKEGGICEIQ